MLILKAKEHKWGLIGPGDWETRSWKINDDGWYQYKESYLKTKTGVRPNTLSNYNFVRNLLAGRTLVIRPRNGKINRAFAWGER